MTPGAVTVTIIIGVLIYLTISAYVCLIVHEQIRKRRNRITGESEEETDGEQCGWDER